MIKFSILIATKNRLQDLKLTLKKTNHLLKRSDVECVICDDGSNDETSSFIINNYPDIKLIKNSVSKGLIYSRNRLLNIAKGDFLISLDDDSYFVTEYPLEIIENFFIKNNKCAVQAFRIFWGEKLVENIECDLNNKRVKGFVGCGHVWNMSAWKEIQSYPEWFVFYGEEEFASYQLFKKKWEIWYIPDILIHHRVNIKKRKYGQDYYLRLRRSLRAGWFLYFLFYPIKMIPKRFLYTLWVQLKLKVFKDADIKALLIILLAICDIIVNSLNYFKNKELRLTKKEFEEYNKLENTKIYWK